MRILERMMALLAGPPGVGKTTIAAALRTRHPKVIEVVSFGQLVYEAVSTRLGEDMSYSKFRESAASLVSREDMMTATTLLIRRKSDLGPRWLLVDSHAVAQTRYGCQAHPDTPETLRRFSYDIILYLDATPELILERIQQNAAGRHIPSVRGMELLNSLQMSIAAYYAGVIGCPLEVIDATGAQSEVAGVLESVLGLT